jgi:hypothetical protein
LNQEQANILMEGSPVDAPDMVASFLSLILTAFYFLPIYPKGLTLALFGSILTWFSYRFVMITMKKKPPMMSSMLIVFFIYIMPLLTFSMGMSNVYYVSTLNNLYNLSGNNKTIGLAWGSFVITCVFLNPTVNGLIYKVFTWVIKFDENAGNEKYLNEFLTFQEDYDRVNPLSKKSGQLRILQQKILQAEAMANPD